MFPNLIIGLYSCEKKYMKDFCDSLIEYLALHELNLDERFLRESSDVTKTVTSMRVYIYEVTASGKAFTAHALW